MNNMLSHHHFVLQGKCLPQRIITEQTLVTFLLDCLQVTGMHCLIPPAVKLSDQNAWTGIMGIITSHISFHYFVDQGEIQFDVYSCKPFDRPTLKEFLVGWWGITESHTLFIDRAAGQPFVIEKE